MWMNGKAHGAGTAYVNMMCTYYGQWVNGKRQGMFKIVALDNSFHEEGMFNDNNQCGKWTTCVHFVWTDKMEYNPKLYPKKYTFFDIDSTLPKLHFCVSRIVLFKFLDTVSKIVYSVYIH